MPTKKEIAEISYISPTVTPRFLISALQPSEVGSDRISAWVDLEHRAVEANAFLSPYFVMPAIQYLETKGSILMLFVEREYAGIKELVGVAIFNIRKPTEKFPLPHLLAFDTVHSFLSGFLIDKEHTGKVLEMIYGFIANSNQPWHGLKLNNSSPELFFSEEGRQIAKDRGLNWTVQSTWQRAVLFPARVKKQGLEFLQKEQKKKYQKRLRQMQEAGTSDWKLVKSEESLDRSTDDFIRLEHMGWKGERGTSLYSNPNHTRFFKEVVDGFNREKRVYFTELSLNGQTISSTSNLISGQAAFAFKIGWNPEYAKFSPGIINEIQFIERQPSLGDITFIDSCSEPNSYLDELWPDRRNVVKGIYTFTKLGQTALNLIHSIKNIKRLFGGTKNNLISFCLVFEHYLNEFGIAIMAYQ